MIRELKQNEIKEAVNLILEVYYETEVNNDTKEGTAYFVSIYANEEHILKLINEGSLKAYGYFIDGELVGVTSIHNDDEIMHLFVKKSFHGRGIAKALLKHICERSKERGIKRIHLDSSRYAINFYLSHGFTKESDEVRVDGMVYTPMHKDL